MLNSAEHRINPAYKSQIANSRKFFLAKLGWAWKMSLLINTKMPTIVGIFIFILAEKISCSAEKSFITSEPGISSLLRIFIFTYHFYPKAFYILYYTQINKYWSGKTKTFIAIYAPRENGNVIQYMRAVYISISIRMLCMVSGYYMCIVV